MAADTRLKQKLRRQRERALAKQILKLPKKKFGVILADPEWRFEPYSRITGMDRSADNHYVTSPLHNIKTRDVPSISAKHSVLFLWATPPMLTHALEVMAAWGFTYITNAVLVRPSIGTGYWFRFRHEHLLLGKRGDVPCPAPGEQWESVLEAARGRHSEKPTMVYDLIEEYFPNLPKIELNARRARPGWSRWGAEAPK